MPQILEDLVEAVNLVHKARVLQRIVQQMEDVGHRDEDEANIEADNCSANHRLHCSNRHIEESSTSSLRQDAREKVVQHAPNWLDKNRLAAKDEFEARHKKTAGRRQGAADEQAAAAATKQ